MLRAFERVSIRKIPLIHKEPGKDIYYYIQQNQPFRNSSYLRDNKIMTKYYVFRIGGLSLPRAQPG